MVKPVVGVCDTDPGIRQLLLGLLKGEGYEVVSIGSSDSILKVMNEQTPHALLLEDLKLCEKIRHDWPYVSMIVLSEVDEVLQKVRALDLGADDYITKPFHRQELLARIRAHLRRRARTSGSVSPSSREQKRAISRDKAISIDVENHCVLVRGQNVQLAPKEFAVLWYLMINQGKALTTPELLRYAWGADYGEESELLRMCVRKIRRKIEENPSEPVYIRTENRVGYKFLSPSLSLPFGRS